MRAAPWFLPFLLACGQPHSSDCEAAPPADAAPEPWLGALGELDFVGKAVPVAVDEAGRSWELGHVDRDLQGSRQVTRRSPEGVTELQFEVAGALNAYQEAPLLAVGPERVFVGSSFEGSMSTGAGTRWSGTSQDVLIEAYCPGGSPRWFRVLDSEGWDHLEALVPDGRGGVWAVIHRSERSSNIDAFDLLLVHLDADGDIDITRQHDLPQGSFYAVLVAPTPDGGVAVIGYASRTLDVDDHTIQAGEFAHVLLVFDGDGVLAWPHVFHATTTALAVHPTGDVVVAIADTGSSRVERVKPDGSTAWSWASDAYGDPVQVAAGSGLVFLAQIIQTAGYAQDFLIDAVDDATGVHTLNTSLLPGRAVPLYSTLELRLLAPHRLFASGSAFVGDDASFTWREDEELGVASFLGVFALD